MINNSSAKLILEDGTILSGESVGMCGITYGEVVFNTAMTGYESILTDPSYNGQIVTFTFPHIGNTGLNSIDYESKSAQVSGLVMCNCSKMASNGRAEYSFVEFLINNSIIAISGIDTRYLTQHLRNKGVMRACITTSVINSEKEREIIRKLKEDKFVQSPCDSLLERYTSNKSSIEKHKITVALYDFGLKHGIFNQLIKCGCNVIIVPPLTNLIELKKINPDGVVLSNGPGDPELLTQEIGIIKKILDANIPTLGICLGHQLLAIALGGNTKKLKFGHHGINHPVLDLKNGKVLITSQNHGYVVDEKSLPLNVLITHKSLFDETIQGIQHTDKPFFGFQGHPEGGPGPIDIAYIFYEFIVNIKIIKNFNLMGTSIEYHAEAK